MLNKINEAATFIKQSFNTSVNTAVILGSGLGSFSKDIEIIKELPFETIPGFANTTVEGHSGSLQLAKVDETDFLILNGRLHFYEGYSMEEITFPIRVFSMLGIKHLLLSNAAGGMNPDYKVGDIMIISDHICLMPNPLIGKHEPSFGARFPDMSEAYNAGLVAEAENIASQNSIDLRKGVYVGVSGPTYETPAEYRFFRIIGGDVVGMSTVPEAIVANQMGLKCFGLSVITDLGVEGKIEFVTHEMVQKAAAEAEPKVAAIFKGLIKHIG